jgi:hypothetical protein
MLVTTIWFTASSSFLVIYSQRFVFLSMLVLSLATSQFIIFGMLSTTMPTLVDAVVIILFDIGYN